MRNPFLTTSQSPSNEGLPIVIPFTDDDIKNIAAKCLRYYDERSFNDIVEDNNIEHATKIRLLCFLCQEIEKLQVSLAYYPWQLHKDIIVKKSEIVLKNNIVQYQMPENQSFRSLSPTGAQIAHDNESYKEFICDFFTCTRFSEILKKALSQATSESSLLGRATETQSQAGRTCLFGKWCNKLTSCLRPRANDTTDSFLKEAESYYIDTTKAKIGIRPKSEPSFTHRRGTYAPVRVRHSHSTTEYSGFFKRVNTPPYYQTGKKFRPIKPLNTA